MFQASKSYLAPWSAAGISNQQPSVVTHSTQAKQYRLVRQTLNSHNIIITLEFLIKCHWYKMFLVIIGSGSGLVPVQAPRHYLSQRWPKSLIKYYVIKHVKHHMVSWGHNELIWGYDHYHPVPQRLDAGSFNEQCTHCSGSQSWGKCTKDINKSIVYATHVLWSYDDSFTLFLHQLRLNKLKEQNFLYLLRQNKFKATGKYYNI